MTAWLARLSSAAAQYGDAILGGSRLGHELADFAVESKRTLRVAGSRLRGRFFVLIGGQAAKAERQLADLGGNRDHLALLRGHLECRGMRNERFAGLAVELLVDPDHAHVLQYRFCGLMLGLTVACPVGDQDVDLISRKDKARDAGG